MILTILQARYSSTRLPGKVLQPILGEPMLARQIERVRRSRAGSQLVVATSEDASDNAIQNLCDALKVSCFRGSLNDVLDRFYHAALPYHPEHVVRLTGDCPLADPELINQVVDFHLAGKFDYSSNALHPKFPDGLDIEVCTFAALKRAWVEAKTTSQREHVMPFLHQQPDMFKLGSFERASDLSALRWTVDEPLDFELIETIYKNLFPINSAFGTQEILDFLETRPELKTHNTRHTRNEGYATSLMNDSRIS